MSCSNRHRVGERLVQVVEGLVVAALSVGDVRQRGQRLTDGVVDTRRRALVDYVLCKRFGSIKVSFPEGQEAEPDPTAGRSDQVPEVIVFRRAPTRSYGVHQLAESTSSLAT
jgi:hypothetical protein